MNHNTRKKIRKFTLKILDSNIIYYLMMLIIVSFLFYNDTKSRGLEDLFDITVITSLLIGFIATHASRVLSKKISRQLEDDIKLSTDYDMMVNKYPSCNKMIRYENSINSNYKKGRKYTSVKKVNKDPEIYHDEYIFTVVLEVLCHDYDIIVKDSKKQYILPDIIEQNYVSIMNAHNHSYLYNSLNIRVDNYSIEENNLILHTSRNTYFDSLVTNRAMDYKWGLSESANVRELFSPGPIFEELNESLLSNHLGYNGFIETDDNDIIFILRSKNLSIGKETLGTSVGAALKTEYSLDKNGDFSSEGLLNSIILEINDELGIPITGEDEKTGKVMKYYDISLKDNIIALYRDMVEGGKPQLLFYVKTELSTKAVKNKFEKAKEKYRNDKKGNAIMDGKKMILIKKDDLYNMYITPDIIVTGNKSYRIMPSASASIVMLIKYLREESKYQDQV